MRVSVPGHPCGGVLTFRGFTTISAAPTTNSSQNRMQTWKKTHARNIIQQFLHENIDNTYREEMMFSKYTRKQFIVIFP